VWPTQPTSCRCILIFSSHLCLGIPSVLLPLGSPTKPLYIPLLSPLRATCPDHFILLHLITRMTLGKARTAWPFSLCSLLQSPATMCQAKNCSAKNSELYKRCIRNKKMTLLYRPSNLCRLFCDATDIAGPRPPVSWLRLRDSTQSHGTRWDSSVRVISRS